MRIDYHSHVLPCIDDGSSSPEESVAILKQSAKQGVSLMIATPHFYFHQYKDADDFLAARSASRQMLDSYIKKEDCFSEIPHLLMGAEVHLSPEVASMPDLNKLCIEGTNYILLELPFQPWSPWVYQSVFEIISKHNLQPILAHLERYLPMNNDNLPQLLSMEVYVQVNADSVCGFFTFHDVKKLYNSGLPLLIGSDVHNINVRKTHFGKAVKKAERKFGSEFFERTENIGKTFSDILKEK